MKNDFHSDQESPDQETTRSGKVALLWRVEWIVAIALSAVVLFLLVVRATHAGALWRDEAESAQSARMPIGEMVENIQYTSFPILFPVFVRAYTTVFGASDISLRCFGLAVGIFLLGVAWLHLRRLTGDVPLLFPAMIGLNVNFLTAGTSLRGYGFGSVLVLLAFVFTVKLLVNPNARTLASVFVAYLASMQFLFFNGALVMAIVIAAMAVLLVCGQVKWIWFLICVAGGCGLSYISYLLQFYFHASSWAKLLEVPVSFGLIWRPFMGAWGEISTGASAMWLGVIFLSLIGAVWRLATTWSNDRPHKCDLLLFGILLIPGSMITSYAFVRVLPRAPDERYFLALTILLAATVDLLLANFLRHHGLRIARIGLVILATIWLPFTVWPQIVQAESNVDIVAEAVEKNAGPADLIVVSPWSFGVSFNWYYHGATRWITVPEMDDHRVHRYDLLLRKMESVDPLEDAKREIATTLKSGNRIWFVGQAELPAPGEGPLQLSPTPDPKFGWQAPVYRKAWSQEIGLFLWRHFQRTNQVALRTEHAISARENMFLYLLEGWKD